MARHLGQIQFEIRSEDVNQGAIDKIARIIDDDKFVNGRHSFGTILSLFNWHDFRLDGRDWTLFD